MIVIILTILLALETGIIVWQYREMSRRTVIVEDLAEIAAELSAKTNMSYDTAFQSLVTLTYTAPERIRRR